jgi:cephalosporin hydroxylase
MELAAYPNTVRLCQALKDQTGTRVEQSPEELQTLAALVMAVRPQVFLEIGSYEGGTLFTLASCCRPPSPLVISVDNGAPALRARLAQTVDLLGHNGVEAHWINANSHDPDTLAQVRDLLSGRPVDVLLIDGDHSREGVLADWHAYGPLVRPGGLVALHDITYVKARVRLAWPEIARQAATWCEILGPPQSDGIGVTGFGIVWIGADTWAKTEPQSQ